MPSRVREEVRVHFSTVDPALVSRVYDIAAERKRITCPARRCTTVLLSYDSCACMYVCVGVRGLLGQNSGWKKALEL